ncbi:MAG: hemagglutinin repeat-containing protein [Rickettsiales bacterium]|jgi:filamentous hemagglutinin family protein|nr:hemagglutinin repeat-containing protein [Rickettsiales bacterium]
MSKNHPSSNKVDPVGCRKLVSFLLCWSLILNNVLLVPSTRAAYSIVPKDNNIRVYNLEEDREVIVIDIAKPVKGASINIFSNFQDDGGRKILLNNSRVKTRSVLTTQKIDPNPNLDSEEADSIAFYLVSSGSNNASLLASSFEVLGDKKIDLFILSNPDGMTLRGGKYLNMKKLFLASGILAADNEFTHVADANGGRISLLPTYNNSSHLAIDASGVDELEIVARRINLGGEVLVKGLLSIRADKYGGMVYGESRKENTERAFKIVDKLKIDTGNLFETSSFGFVRVGNLRLDVRGKDNLAKIGTTLVNFSGDSVIDLQGGMVLEGEKAKFLVEQGSLTLTARALTLNNRAVLFSQGSMWLNLNGQLLNSGRSLISTEAGGITIKTADGVLKNLEASTIKSGGDITFNGLSLTNVGIDVPGKKGQIYESRYVKTGLEPRSNTVSYAQDVVDMFAETDPSSILAKGNITLKTIGTVENCGSEIVAGGTLRIDGEKVNNDRRIFDVDVKYSTCSHWTRPRFLSASKSKWETNDYYNREFFYSRTPSLMIGQKLEITANIIQIDSKKMNPDADPNKSSSRLEASDLAYIRAKSIINRGLVIATEGKLDVLVENLIDTRGGSFISKMGGKVESSNEINEEALIKVFNAGGNIFSTPVQMSAIGIVDTEKYMLGDGRRRAESPGSSEPRVMIVKAKIFKMAGSFLLGDKGTIKVIAGKLEAGASKIRNRIESGSRDDWYSLIDNTQNLMSTIKADKIEIEVDDFEINGAEVDGTYGVDVKVKNKFVVNDVHNTNQVEQKTNSEGLLSSEEDHDLMNTDSVLKAKFSSSQGSVNIEGGEGIYIKNVDFDVQKDVNLISDGDVIIESTESTYSAEHSHSESNFDGFTAEADSTGLSVGSKMNNRVEETKSSGSEVDKSAVNAGGKFSIKAKNALIKGVDVNADEIELDVEKNIQLLAASEYSKEEHSEQELSITTSYRIGNSYVDTVSAAVSIAENKTRALEALDAMVEMQELYEKGKASKKALANAKENLALATANAGMSVIQLAKQAALSAGTTLVGGFYATLDVQTLGTEISSIQEKMGFVQNTMNARKVTIKSGGDAHLEAQINTSEELNIDVKGDLDLESLQNSEESSSKKKQLGGSISGSGSGTVNAGSHLTEADSKTVEQSYLKSQGEVHINVGGDLHMKGSTIDSDTEQLNVKVNGKLISEDLKNEEHQSSDGFDVSTAVSLDGKTTLNLQESEKEKRSVIRATIGKGNLEVGEGDADINRDIEKTEELEVDRVVSSLDVKIVADHRLLTSDGREQMLEELKDLKDLPRNLVVSGENVVLNPLTTGVAGYLANRDEDEDSSILKSIIEKVKKDLQFDATVLKLKKLSNLEDQKAVREVIEDIVKDIGSNKGKEIEVILHNDPEGSKSFSTPDRENPDGTVSRTIYINLAKVKTEKDLMMALFHESYDPAKHGKNERLAENYASHIERTWDIIMYGRENRSLDILDKIDTTEANRRAEDTLRTKEVLLSADLASAGMVLTASEAALLGIEVGTLVTGAITVVAVGFGIYVAYQGGKIVKKWAVERNARTASAEAARVEAAWTSYLKTLSDKNKAAAEAGTTAGTAAGGGGGGNKKDKKESKRDKKKKGGQKTKPGEGELPEGVKDFHKGNEKVASSERGVPLDKTHVHFKNGKNKLALNADGTMKHGTKEQLRKVLTNKIREWLRDNGFRLPPGL